jgi:SNF2 family DNA or RNA helicase
MENLMNLIMQFRKVCNHPELFDRRLGKTPFFFKTNPKQVCPSSNLISQVPVILSYNKTPISYTIPKLIYDEAYNINQELMMGGQYKDSETSFRNKTMMRASS